MTSLRARNSIAAWLALVGVALNASWPLLANAKPSVPALPSEICSATGLKHAGEGSPGDAPGKNVSPSHCTLCPGNAERGAALSGIVAVLFRSAPACAQAPAFFAGARLQAAPAFSGSPRSPPALS